MKTWEDVSNDELNEIMDDYYLSENEVLGIIDELERREPDPDVGMAGAGSPAWFRDRIRYMHRRLARIRSREQANVQH